ncbi:MAG: prepilin-type N-terminal cleavage/methylation domain-containing protein [Thermodesulfobacteriota bacterium]|nr:prepilin-type N-terminal cleavage/methylation domain-containing protein [Thermodesulfobacteriota bacterium]
MLNRQGFTLIEVLIAMVMSAIVTSAVFMAYRTQQECYVAQEQVAAMQQNLKAAMFYMGREIRMAGYDTASTGNFGIQTAAPDSITFTCDITGGESDGRDNDMDGFIDEDTNGEDDDLDGVIDAGPEVDEFRFGDTLADDPNETVTYSLFDIDGDGDMDLRRQDAAQPPADPTLPEEEFVAEDVEALGFAYAFDANNDGLFDTYDAVNAPAGSPRERTIWAIDSDGDNLLETNLDADSDGDIDADDGPGIGGNGLIGGQMLMDFAGIAIANVPVGRIRAVRIWLLARSTRSDRKLLTSATYVVGNQVITPATDGDANNDHRRMRLLMTTAKCRNL